MIRKYGLEYANKKFVPINGFDATKQGSKATAKGNPTSTPRKRKPDDDAQAAANDKRTPGSATKKRKSKPSRTQKEEIEEEDIENDS